MCPVTQQTPGKAEVENMSLSTRSEVLPFRDSQRCWILSPVDQSQVGLQNFSLC